MGFDLTVHHIDAKTGRVKRVNPYKLHIKQGNRIYERYNKFFLENGVECDSEGNVIKAPKAAPAVVEEETPVVVEAQDKKPSKPKF
jgi:hypothetical protein